MDDGPSVLFTEDDIRRRVRELGGAITRDYAGREPVLVSVLKGGAWFLSDLLKEIRIHTRVDFMSITPYEGGDEETGVVRILKDLDQDIGGDHVIVVEDIVDTGLTLTYLLGALEARGPASIAVCALLDKSARRITPIEIRYRGFECPDQFVIGYGLDYEELYRNLPYILAVDPEELAENRLAFASALEDAPPPRRLS